MKRLLKFCFYSFLLIFLFYFVVYLVSFSKGKFGNVEVDGISMLPTFQSGEMVFVNRHENPSVGDIISFRCISEKCGHHVRIVHRITSIESDGCMNIEGDNQPISWDTRDYGCFMPDEISIEGVVHKIPKFPL